MIAIVDYGSGNIQAIQNIFTKLKIETFFASRPEDLKKASKIILPGVGAFDTAMMQLEQSGMRSALDACVLVEKKPVMGICVGMQIMAKSSEEGVLSGLGWFDATVKKFDESKIEHKPKLPHMGWNEIVPREEHPILNNIDQEKGFYFIHSYYFNAHDPNDIFIEAYYGCDFCCAVKKNNIFGFQFHPEKSHSNGINLFKNFYEFSLC
ncbi:imidazole glycerol phosphate synthase subunit HisH [Marinomonas sp. UCMA 3892]|uniref:imidazole glycerol phosphate synthase subunit HisH n=1 Tax=Marinomonas sp. UCMA 3892 TaxID=1972585 RepID=UPI00146DBF19|nr:imidazole glycerol phosphate synthase subunit HisH [Marinomonas sp. UCMA 3892]